MPLSLNSVVIDVNVFLHAQNPGVYCYDASDQFLRDVKNSNIRICVDEDGLIEHHYAGKLGGATPGRAGKAAYAEFIKNGRFDPIPLKIYQRKKIIIHKLIHRRNRRDTSYKRDRTFVIIAYNSDSKLVTNDFEHFQNRTRGELYRQLRLEVHCAGTFYTLDSCASCSNC